jgi:hypothetical protein
MGMVDVVTEIEIRRPREVVAAYAGNPDNAPDWYTNIRAVNWETAPPLVPGSRVAFKALFLGKALDYVYEFTELDPGKKLVMGTGQGPFPMQTTYTWADAGKGSTQMTLRNTGESVGLLRHRQPRHGSHDGPRHAQGPQETQGPPRGLSQPAER